MITTTTPAPPVRAKKTPPKFRHWVYTLNNPQDGEVIDNALATYHVYGREIGASGTPHLQGYICMKKEYRATAMKKINARAHWEPKRGTSKEASDYCKKDGDYKEFGVLPKTGPERNKIDYAQLWNDLKTKPIEEIDPKFLCYHYGTVQRVKKDFPAKLPDLPDVCGVWIYGPSGVGKSRLAREMASNNAYPKKVSRWWDGYQGEDYVIMDDVSPKASDWIAYYLKLWADAFPFVAETKGGSMVIRPKHFIVTSQYTIGDILRDSPLDLEAVERRFKIINKKD